MPRFPSELSFSHISPPPKRQEERELDELTPVHRTQSQDSFESVPIQSPNHATSQSYDPEQSLLEIESNWSVLPAIDALAESVPVFRCNLIRKQFNLSDAQVQENRLPLAIFEYLLIRDLSAACKESRRELYSLAPSEIESKITQLLEQKKPASIFVNWLKLKTSSTQEALPSRAHLEADSHSGVFSLLESRLKKIPHTDMAQFEFQLSKELYDVINQKKQEVARLDTIELTEMIKQLNQIGESLDAIHQVRRNTFKAALSWFLPHHHLEQQSQRKAIDALNWSVRALDLLRLGTKERIAN